MIRCYLVVTAAACKLLCPTPVSCTALLPKLMQLWIPDSGDGCKSEAAGVGGMEEMGSAVTMTDREKHLAPLRPHGHGAIPTFTLPVKVGTWKRR